jgi:DNA-binding transcriptional LysR family regulator
MLDLVCLRSFVHVCERGTIAAAAADLGYTAPAVSQHIAKLERDVGVAVFDRVAGRLRPSAAGDQLLVLAASMLDLAERCQQVAATTPVPPPVVIAAFASAFSALVVPALPALAGRPVTVRGAEDDEALRQLRLGLADVALVQHYDHAPFVEDARLIYREIARDRLRLVLPPDRPPSTRLADLDGSPWLLNGDGTQCSSAVRAMLATAGVVPDVRGSLDDNHALFALVAAGHGVCIVPDLVLAEVGRDVDVTVARQRLSATRAIVAVTRRSGDRAHEAVVAALARARRDASGQR